MALQLLYLMLSLMGVMFAGPLLTMLSVMIFKIDVNRILSEHGIACAIVFALYGAFVTFMFFVLQDIFIAFWPEPGTRPLAKQELVTQIEDAFSRPVEGEKLFDVARNGDSLIVTWSASLRFFQGTSAGGRGMKRVVVLSFDENSHRAFFIMKNRDYGWSAALGSTEFSLRLSTGISAEKRTEAAPSIEYSSEKGLRVDLKTITYDSDDLLQPILKAVLGAGWSLHGGMAQGFWARMLFVVPMGLLFLAVGVFAATLFAGGGQAARKAASAPASGPADIQPLPDVENQLKAVLPSMKTEIIAAQIAGIIKTPPDHLQEYARKALVPFINAYAGREGKDEALLAEAIAFAERLHLKGIEPRPPAN